MNKKYCLSILLLFVSTLLPSIGGCQKNESSVKETILKPNVAGSFYPSDKNELRTAIEKYISEAKVKKMDKVRAIIAPHAGYIYSGPTAGYAYAALKGAAYDTVMVIGPSHHVMFKGISILECSAVETPLGEIPVSNIVKELISEEDFAVNPRAYEKEHSVEVQFPFLQVALNKFSVVPMVAGRLNVSKTAKTISKYLDEKTLIVVSSDLSHYLDYKAAKDIDRATVQMILEMRNDVLELPSFEACGKEAILVLIEIAKEKGWTPRLLDLRNSGDTAGEKDGVVGYAAIAFEESEKKSAIPEDEKGAKISEEDGDYLLELARKSIEHYLSKENMLKVDEKEVPESCRELRGCFVTLTEKGQLRGCIGSLIPDKNLYENVIENAVNAAVNDPRFTPINQEELDQIHIEISVLTLPKKLIYSGEKELLEKLQPNIDGVILTFMDRLQSTYLPQVWEQIPDKVMFLNSLTKKANPNLPEDAWKNEYTKVFKYQAQIFEEKKKAVTEEKEGKN